ncbi:alpha-N-acetylglucosaminidase [Coprobacter fastidiosus]|jgi:alpha-N-acetylglucosaminidase
MIRKNFYSLFLLFLLPITLSASETRIATQLAERIIPRHAQHFNFKQKKSDDGKDFFRIESLKGKIVITGNNANSMATGLNHYLKYYCLTTVSWYADIPVEMPDTLPMLKQPIEHKAKVERRFFLNYCTYGYTMPFWQWKNWERLIDWMALNGINMPLAITGQEAVWYKVWHKLGLSDQEIRSYFTGPTYLPWHRMANIDGWNGPLPIHWINSQVTLQKQILKRERELSMHPVLPAFAGHVPHALKRIYPNANIQTLGKWAGFDKAYHCYFLNPEDPLFAKIQQLYLKEQTALFGTDHIYGIDPFNEVDPPSWEPEYLKQVSSNMYHTLTQADPKAEWLQMTWMFYFDKEKWTAPRIEALLTGVPQNKMILLDYHCENVELWKQTQRFHGQPYIWCYLGNFGGNTAMIGNVKESGARLENALKNGGKNLWGIGSTLEGFDVTQFPFEYIFEKAWNHSLSNEEWVNFLADRHVGTINSSVRESWQLLFNDIFTQIPKVLGILPNLRPEYNKNNPRTTIEYENSKLFRAFELLLKESQIKHDTHKLDIIMIGRQMLGNLFLEKKDSLDKAFGKKDLDEVKRLSAIMRELLRDIDILTSYHPHCSLSSWLDAARSYGDTPMLKDYYERNARNLITTWGGSLNDYANRTWAGLIRDYYAQRWEMYFEALLHSLQTGTKFDQKDLNKRIKTFEDAWVNSVEPISIFQPKQPLHKFATSLLHKYKDL